MTSPTPCTLAMWSPVAKTSANYLVQPFLIGDRSYFSHIAINIRQKVRLTNTNYFKKRIRWLVSYTWSSMVWALPQFTAFPTLLCSAEISLFYSFVNASFTSASMTVSPFVIPSSILLASIQILPTLLVLYQMLPPNPCRLPSPKNCGLFSLYSQNPQVNMIGSLQSDYYESDTVFSPCLNSPASNSITYR